MKKKISLLLTLVISLCVISKVEAASMSMYANKQTVTVGSTVTVTVKASDVAGSFKTYSSNNNILSGGGTKFIDNGSATYTFTAKSVGTTNITATAVDAADYNEKTFSGSRAISIRVVNKTTNTSNNSNNNTTTVKKSSNNLLKSLKVGDYKLSPEFNKDTTSYNLTVPKETEKVKIEANAEDSKAKVNGTGEKSVSEGMNKFDVVVTAENGYKKTYTLNIEVEENPITVTVNGEEYSVIKKENAMPEKPNYYDSTTVKIDDKEVPAYKGTILDYLLVGLKNSEGKTNLYIYDEDKKSYKLYEEIKFNQIVLYNLEFPKSKIPKSYKKYTETIDEKELTVYKLSKDSKYSLIYGINIETGKENVYKYDKNENTLQIFEREEQKILEEEIEKYQKLIMILGGVILVLILLVTIGFTRKPKQKSVVIENVDQEFLTKKEIKKIEKENKKLSKKNKNKEEA